MTEPTSDWREDRRRRAWVLHQQGWTQRRIAAELAVTQGAVSQWLRQARIGGGVEALRRHPAPGQKPKLTDEQFTQIGALLEQGAEAFGFQGNRWTSARVATAIKEVFGVSYHPSHLSRLLRLNYPGWTSKPPNKTCTPGNADSGLETSRTVE